MHDRLRALPSVDELARNLPSLPHPIAVSIARRSLQEARDRIKSGATLSDEELHALARTLVDEHTSSLLFPVINATGVMIHTNLGRVPLGPEQLEAVTRIAGSYSNLEYDLIEGTRGDRYEQVRSSLSALIGSESALVVNNNAAAILLVLSALCPGKEVIISRGELIEIGGEFRIPDVIASSGAAMVEVGTTNRTRVSDYERAISPRTAAILKVHPSNYKIVGFTESASDRDLARLARGRGVLLIHDLGSGLVRGGPDDSLDASWLADEPLVTQAVERGADIITFSGDKLLAGPQAGLIAGRDWLIEKISRHPLMRAVRPDKMTLAALQATLRIHLEGRTDELPLWRMLNESVESLAARAQALVDELSSRLEGLKVEARPVSSVVGGGSLPGVELPSWAVAVVHPEIGAAICHKALRNGTPPVIGRVEDGVVVLDLRTVDPSQTDGLLAAVLAAFSRARP